MEFKQVWEKKDNSICVSVHECWHEMRYRFLITTYRDGSKNFTCWDADKEELVFDHEVKA